MDDLKSYADLVQWLKGQGAHREQHSGSNLLAHLEKTYAILKGAGQSDEVCLAGLFHSVYGTSSFKTVTVPESKRAEVQGMIGPGAEQIAWLFCKLDRPRAFQLHLTTNPASLPAHGGGELKLAENALAESLPHLLSIEAANLLEQRVIWRNQWLMPHAKAAGIISQAGDGPVAANTAHESAMVANAKHGIFRELVASVNAKRQSMASGFAWGDNLRTLKLMQAQHVLGLSEHDAYDPQAVSLVLSYAEAYGITVVVAAELIVQKAQEFQDVLLKTEFDKDLLVGRLRVATSMDDLNLVRRDTGRVGNL